MASLQDIAVAAGINLFSALMFLLAFAFLRLQPINDRVYFPKWYLKGSRTSPKAQSGALVTKFVNLNIKTYLRFLSWMPAALTMPEVDLIDHAGLDSAVYLRIYLLGLKIFSPIALLGFIILVPINWTGKSLKNKKDLMYNNIDKLSISNVPPKSYRFVAHIFMAYVFSFWTWYILYKEYKIVSAMRLRFLASEKRRADQFTVLVRNIPPDYEESLSEHVEDFFRLNHPDHYLTHQVVYDAGKLAGFVESRKKLENWLTYYQTIYEQKPKRKPKTRTSCYGFWGTSVDAIDYYTTKIQHLSKQELDEREKVVSDKNSIVPAAFVSFKSRWGAAVCAQTQQTDNPTVWLTEWAPEPRDVHWDNLALPYVGLYVRRLIMAVLLFFLTFFFMIPIAFVQSLASIEGIQNVLPFLEPVIKTNGIKGFIQGFLPGIALKIFLLFLPTILMSMSKSEGHTSLSSLERRSAGKYYLFLLVNVFLGSIITGAAFEQLHSFMNKSPTEIPRIVGVAIPMKASFFITYVMVDGWAGIAAEILRLQPLAMFHLKNTFLVKTEQDREQAMDPGALKFAESEPQVQLYFLLGLVYAAVTPVLLPFIIIFFAFSFMVFRNQIINVYDQKYESGATFWPDVHRRIIIDLIISQLLLMGLLSTKGFYRSSPVMFLLPVLTIWFHRFCKGRFENAFIAFPLQNASLKDRLENEAEPGFNLRKYLQDAYVHPVFQDDPIKIQYVANDEENNNTLDVSMRNSSEKDTKEIADDIYDAVNLISDTWESMENDEHSLLDITDLN